MTGHAYTEDQLVEQPAIGLFDELGWQTVSAMEDVFGTSGNMEDIFRDLLALSGALTEEQDRHIREHLSEEELTVFDILTHPGPDLTSAERDEVKKVAQQLLNRLHELLVLNWRQKTQCVYRDAA